MAIEKTKPEDFSILNSEDDVTNFIMDASLTVGRLMEFDGYDTTFTSESAIKLVDGIRRHALSYGKVTPKQQSAVVNVNIAIDNIKKGRSDQEYYRWYNRNRFNIVMPEYSGDGLGNECSSDPFIDGTGIGDDRMGDY